jgi:hypothetical protein
LSKKAKIKRYKTIILFVVLYGCITWSLTLREKHRLKVFESRVLRRIFGSKMDKIIGRWRKLHNDEFHNLYCSPDTTRMIKSRRIRGAGHIERIGQKRNSYRILVVKPEGKRPLERRRRRWKDKIKVDLRDTGWGCMD